MTGWRAGISPSEKGASGERPAPAERLYPHCAQVRVAGGRKRVCGRENASIGEIGRYSPRLDSFEIIVSPLASKTRRAFEVWPCYRRCDALSSSYHEAR